MAIITVTVEQYFAGRPFLETDDVILADTGANIAALTPEQFAELAANFVDRIDTTDNTLALSIDQFVNLGTVALTATAEEVVTFRDTGADLATGSPDQIAELADAGIDIIEASDGPVSFSLDQFVALGTVVFAPGTTATIRDTGANFAGGSPDDVAELATHNVDFIDASDDVLTYSLEQFNALGTVSFVAGDQVTVTGTGAQFGALTTAEIAALSAKNVDILDADSPVALTVEQAAALAGTGMAFAAGDTVSVSDTGTNIATLNEVQIAALGAKGIDTFDASDNAVTLSSQRAAALAGTGIGFAAADVVTVADTGANLAGLTAAQIAALGAKGIDSFDASDNTLTLSAQQAAALAGTNIALGADETVTVSDTGAGIGTLSAAQIVALVTRGVDAFDASDNAAALSLLQLDALGGRLADDDAVTLSDSGTVIRGLTAAQIAALAGEGVVAIDATDNALTLSLDQFNNLGTVALTAADAVTVSAAGSAFAALTGAEIGNLSAKRVDVLDASDNVVALSVTQAAALAGSGLSFAAGDSVTVSGTGAALASLAPSDIASLVSKGIDVFDASDNTLTLTAAQAAALAGGGAGAASNDAVAVIDTGAALSALTPAQIAALNGKGIDALNATDNALSLSLAQFNALGSIGLTAGDAIRLSDSGTALSTLSAGQIAGLAGRGIDSLDATDNVFNLSLAQYQAAAALQFAPEDRLKISGTGASEAINGRSTGDTIKGFGGNDRVSGGDGNDWVYGGAGKDVLAGNGGFDGFVFDTRPNKRTNLDTIKDFNVRDDTVYLDNAIFKKLGRGSEANPTKVNKAYFQVGERADDRNDYLIYNKKTGILYYDADGSGGGAQVEVAKLAKNLRLTDKDFFVL